MEELCLTDEDCRTLMWLILTGKTKCEKKIRRMRMMDDWRSQEGQEELQEWVDKRKAIKKLEKKTRKMLDGEKYVILDNGCLMHDWIKIEDKLPPADIDVVLYDAYLNSLFVSHAGGEQRTATHWLPLKEIQEAEDMPDLPKKETSQWKK